MFIVCYLNGIFKIYALDHWTIDMYESEHFTFKSWNLFYIELENDDQHYDKVEGNVI
jgi:hypothetical protein